MSVTAHFKVETDEHVAWLTLDRPEKRNTMGTGVDRPGFLCRESSADGADHTDLRRS